MSYDRPHDGTNDTPGPLRGVKVLDASTMLAGPLTGGLLADFGADVIKVEDIRGGDPMRLISADEQGRSVQSKISNRNKRSIAIDLRHERGQALFLDLAAQVDVVSTNFRMSTLEKWGLGYSALSAANPGLIMYHLSALGRSGSRRDDPGFARVAEAYAGLTYASGEPDGPPMFSGYAIADGVGGLHGAFSILLALYEAQRSGRGQLVELSLAGATLRMLEGLVAAYETSGRSPERTGNRNGIAPNGIYRTGDDQWIVVPISTPSMWLRFGTAIGRPELVDDERFRTNADRVRNREALDALLEPEFASRTLDQLYDALRSNEVAVGRVNSMADLFADDDAWTEGMLVRVPDTQYRRSIGMPGVIPHLSVTPGRIRHVGPDAGEHTTEVLRELLCIDDNGIDSLRLAGVIS
ncbi:formyl-CoA transferase [Antricoccus suffuscus]|uniref:Formyl-CoA transferase n=1 Tax=Antricoccus suffuscus TaxID=1629062 RepID=A0A2T1A623_9ACTN|nr:CoA transferase [Antricoccus suffuscus]PRZ44039.1 formyl-CoA transferase [Antricoccus suffuscus]